MRISKRNHKYGTEYVEITGAMGLSTSMALLINAFCKKHG
jgi:hypothetical protein